MTGYAVTAQYYDPLAATGHAAVDAQIAAALAGLDTAPGPVLDIGAGTGLTTALIAAALPEVEVWAIEPDPAMRPALMTRVWSDLELRRRVTIVPCGILDAPLPSEIAGAVLSASLVHFSPEERQRLWGILAQKLAPMGRVICEIQCPEAVAMPETLMASAQVGRVTYRGTAAAQPLSHNRQRWRMTYRATMDDEDLARDEAIYECWVISAETVLAEAATYGLRGDMDQNLVRLCHA